MARAAPPHGVVRLGQRRRVVHERRERGPDAEVADRRALAEARAELDAQLGPTVVQKMRGAGNAYELVNQRGHTLADAYREMCGRLDKAT